MLDRWNAYIDPTWIESLDATPFLTACRQGTVSITDLKQFLVQQYFYSRHFTRYLCALLSNIIDEEDRRELTENLVDETGLGVVKGVPHSKLYRQMLNRFDIDPASFSANRETMSLVVTMLESCRNPNAAVGLGALCLGAEAIVPHVYSQIVTGFESQGVPKSQLDFFLIHIECDDAHAQTMKEIIDREAGGNLDKMALTCSAARVIAARSRFFEALVPKVQTVNLVAERQYSYV